MDKWLPTLCAKLCALEMKYGGVQIVPAQVSSPHGGDVPLGYKQRGGDRMAMNQYVETYAKILPRFESLSPMVVVEIGILRGAGLAMWCDLFPKARVIGLDIAPRYFRSGEQTLRSLGAFQHNKPEIHQFDELAPDAPARLAKIMGDATANLVIDDALHYNEAIAGMFRMMQPHLANRFSYFIEDNTTVHTQLRRDYPQYRWLSVGGLSVAQR